MENSGQLQAAISAQRPGDKVTLGVMRDGKGLTVPVTLESINKKSEEAGNKGGETHGKARWGVELENLTPDLREQLQLPNNVQGVVVGNVVSGQPGGQCRYRAR